MQARYPIENETQLAPGTHSLDATDAESYLNQLVGRMVRIKHVSADELYLNVLSLNALGMLVQDPDYEYFIPWGSIIFVRLANLSESAAMGSPELRRRIEKTVLDVTTTPAER